MLRLQQVDTSLTLTQLSALGTVASRGPLSAGELAAYERVRPPSLSRVLSALEAAGYLQREVHPNDKRTAIIAITPAGVALLETERRSRTAWLAQQLAKLNAVERATLAAVAPLLEKLADS